MLYGKPFCATFVLNCVYLRKWECSKPTSSGGMWPTSVCKPLFTLCDALTVGVCASAAKPGHRGHLAGQLASIGPMRRDLEETGVAGLLLHARMSSLMLSAAHHCICDTHPYYDAFFYIPILTRSTVSTFSSMEMQKESRSSLKRDTCLHRTASKISLKYGHEMCLCCSSVLEKFSDLVNWIIRYPLRYQTVHCLNANCFWWTVQPGWKFPRRNAARNQVKPGFGWLPWQI